MTKDELLNLASIATSQNHHALADSFRIQAFKTRIWIQSENGKWYQVDRPK
jgi:hypothetical protein